MHPRICMSLVGAAVLASCTAPATLPNRTGGYSDSTAVEATPSPSSSTLDLSIAATEMAPSQPNAVSAPAKDPTTNMGDMKGMNMPGMSGIREKMPPGDPSMDNMRGMQGMQMPGMTGMNAAQSQPATTQAAFYYTCSMHPQIHQDHPGNCPICGMKLIKKDISAGTQKGAGQ